MLLQAVETLIESQGLERDKAEALVRAVFRYALKFDAARELKQVASKLDITPAVMEFKRMHLNSSHYVLSRLWRAGYSLYCNQRCCDRCVHCPACTGAEVCNRFEWDLLALASEYRVDLEDVQYLVKNKVYKPTDEKILQERKNALAPADPALVRKVLMDSLPYIKSVVYRKLKFIFRYNNLDPVDFVNDLMAWALCRLNDSDYVSDRDELMRIAATSVNQMSVNLIAQYTAKKRSRLTSTTGGYRSTTVSLEPGVATSLERCSDRLNEEELLNRITVGMTPDELCYLNGRLDGEPKGDLLARLKWTNKRVDSFKAKFKDLLEMCAV